jgi:mono/diheme cytochrome c family protein
MGRNINLTLTGWRGVASALALPVLIVWGSTAATSRTAKPTAKPVAAPSSPTAAELEKQYAKTVLPFLQTYCASCHGKDQPAAQLDLTSYPTMAAVVKGLPHWSLVLEKLAKKQMPPDGSTQPPAKQVEAVMAWIQAARQLEISRNAGDPGPVLARRLSNAEYNYTIRDLTGVDLQPTREFPVDPANQEGFDNTGESLTLSSGLMKKYVQAARGIADNLALTSTGIEFAAHPVLAETDRDKFCIFRIVDFYKKQPTDFADYFQAAWRYKHRAALGAPDATLEGVAAKAQVSPRYLALVWKTLNDSENKVGPIASLQTRWNALPGPVSGTKETPEAVRTNCVALRDWVVALRKNVAWKFDNLKVPRGFSVGGQCFVLWKDRQYASHRRQLYPDGLQVGGIPDSQVVSERRRGSKEKTEKTVTDPVDADLFVPKEEAARAPYIKSFDQFCSVFPDAFYISERGRMFVNEAGDKGRLLTAGLHNSMGYFRDDTPLMELLLNEKEQQELNHLWLDFNMVAAVPERMHLEFFVYERAESGTMVDPEFNFARAEDKDSLSDEKIKRLADLYLAKAKKNGGQPEALQAIEEHFQWVSKTIRATERARLAAEPLHRKALLDFASRAYRRPLSAAEKTNLLGFYQSLRQKEGLNEQDAISDSVVSILMSPNFLFRLDLEAPPAPTPSSRLRTASMTSASPRAVAAPSGDPKLEPLSDYALASRLSYFLWSSMPDKELLSHAAAGDLHKPEVLTAQTRRMLRDPRVRALALEFAGNWLDFRHFEEHNAVDRNRFPTFTNELREAMFEEPVHFLMDEFQNNRSVLDLLYGKYTFVNATLAKHYGMTDIPATAGDNWVRVPDADRYGRGGLLPMAIFLTENSPGLRTSPVKRGYWMVKRVLGEHIPPPPPNVPELPKDEGALGDQTLRQALERHRADPSCAGCHARFDSYGLVFEGYGPIGERRSKDLGGKPVDMKAPFPGGEVQSGVEGLQSFVRRQREQDFLDTYCRKLLSYGLGRSLLPSDEPTLREMRKRLTQNEYRFDTLAETIVNSRQFRNRRATTASLNMASLKG